jgi:preprotein translocase subunit SecE
MTQNGNNKAVSGGKDDGAPKKRTGPAQYVREVRREVRNTTWTSRQETLVSTVLVAVLTGIAVLFFWGVDAIIQWIVNLLLRLG